MVHAAMGHAVVDHAAMGHADDEPTTPATASDGHCALLSLFGDFHDRNPTDRKAKGEVRALVKLDQRPLLGDVLSLSNDWNWGA